MQSQQGHANFQESIFLESECKHYLHRPACWHWLFIRSVFYISLSHSIVRKPTQKHHIPLKPADKRSCPSSAIMSRLAVRISCGTNRAFCVDTFCKNPPRAHHKETLASLTDVHASSSSISLLTPLVCADRNLIDFDHVRHCLWYTFSLFCGYHCVFKTMID